MKTKLRIRSGAYTRGPDVSRITIEASDSSGADARFTFEGVGPDITSLGHCHFVEVEMPDPPVAKAEVKSKRPMSKHVVTSDTFKIRRSYGGALNGVSDHGRITIHLRSGRAASLIALMDEDVDVELCAPIDRLLPLEPGVRAALVPEDGVIGKAADVAESDGAARVERYPSPHGDAWMASIRQQPDWLKTHVAAEPLEEGDLVEMDLQGRVRKVPPKSTKREFGKDPVADARDVAEGNMAWQDAKHAFQRQRDVSVRIGGSQYRTTATVSICSCVPTFDRDGRCIGMFPVRGRPCAFASHNAATGKRASGRAEVSAGEIVNCLAGDAMEAHRRVKDVYGVRWQPVSFLVVEDTVASNGSTVRLVAGWPGVPWNIAAGTPLEWKPPLHFRNAYSRLIAAESFTGGSDT